MKNNNSKINGNYSTYVYGSSYASRYIPPRQYVQIFDHTLEEEEPKEPSLSDWLKTIK